MKKLAKFQLPIILLALLVPRLGLADPLTLTAGSRSEISPDSSRCFVRERVADDGLFSEHEARCTRGANSIRAEMHLESGSLLISDADFDVKLKIVAQFRVERFEDAPRDSFLPIHIRVPLHWKGLFFNDHSSFSTPGVVSMNMYVRIREGDDANGNIEGSLLAQTRFAGVSHAGIDGCISLPTDAVSAGTMLVKCALASFNGDKGRSPGVELSTVIRTNQVYNLEIVMVGDMDVTGGNPALQAEMVYGLADLIPDEDLGLFWDRPAVVIIGTDAEESLGEIREEIAQLREDFEAHTHVYLTGRGVGHNNTEVLTNPPMFPGSMNGSNHADDGDGVPSFADECPLTPPGVVVDSQGCSREEFCALHSQSKGCKQADWQGDDSGKPADCRWRKKACIAR